MQYHTSWRERQTFFWPKMTAFSVHTYIQEVRVGVFVVESCKSHVSTTNSRRSRAVSPKAIGRPLLKPPHFFPMDPRAFAGETPASPGILHMIQWVFTGETPASPGILPMIQRVFAGETPASPGLIHYLRELESLVLPYRRCSSSYYKFHSN